MMFFFPSQAEAAALLHRRIQPELVAALAARLLEILDKSKPSGR